LTRNPDAVRRLHEQERELTHAKRVSWAHDGALFSVAGMGNRRCSFCIVIKNGIGNEECRKMG